MQQRLRQQQEVQEMEAQVQSFERALHASKAAIVSAAQQEEAQLAMLVAAQRAAEAEKRGVADLLDIKQETAES